MRARERRRRLVIGAILLVWGAALLAYSLASPCQPPSPATGRPAACLGPGVAEILGAIALWAPGAALAVHALFVAPRFPVWDLGGAPSPFRGRRADEPRPTPRSRESRKAGGVLVPRTERIIRRGRSGRSP